MMRPLMLNMGKYAPFVLGVVSYRPSSIVFSLTNRCNCDCVMCRYKNLSQERELSVDEVASILTQAQALGVRDCVFYGGEPLLRPDIFEVVGVAHRMGMKTGIITNGMLATHEVAEKLAQSGLGAVTVSIDAADAVQDLIRDVPDAFSWALEGLKNFIALRKQAGWQVVLAALLFRITLDQNRLLGTIEAARCLDVPVFIQLLDFSVVYFRNQENALKEDLWINEDRQKDLEDLVDRLVALKKKAPDLLVNSFASLRFIKSYFRDPRSQGLPCYKAYSGKIWVDAQGRVYVCQAMAPMGDLTRDRLKDVIASSAWKKNAKEDVYEKVSRVFLRLCIECGC
jgi:MoaA/NifB/PqqE/SkfB family radical SAM enzyme